MEQKNNMNIVLAVVICLALVGVLVFISIKNKTSMVTQNNNNAQNNEIGGPALPAEAAKTGDTVSMNYTGRLENGTVFDSNVDPKFKHVEPFVFKLGAGQVIAGWDEGIVGMKVGEKKTLVIPPNKAYGPNDYGPIPGNSTLTFDVELLGINI
jgi:FKBP-type peptidyl-prolyl cis-trans isomerase